MFTAKSVDVLVCRPLNSKPALFVPVNTSSAVEALKNTAIKQNCAIGQICCHFLFSVFCLL